MMSSPTSESIHQPAAIIAELPVSSKDVSTSSAVSYAPSIPATPSKTRSGSVTERVASPDKSEKNPLTNENYNPIPQCAPGGAFIFSICSEVHIAQLEVFLFYF